MAANFNIEEVLLEGIQIGIEEGKRKKATEIAKRMINHGLDNEFIKEYTDVPIQELEALRKKLENK